MSKHAIKVTLEKNGLYSVLPRDSRYCIGCYANALHCHGHLQLAGKVFELEFSFHIYLPNASDIGGTHFSNTVYQMCKIFQLQKMI